MRDEWEGTGRTGKRGLNRCGESGSATRDAELALAGQRRFSTAAQFADPEASHIVSAVPVPSPHGEVFFLTSSRCGTCHSPYRAIAEDEVVAGVSFRRAAKAVESVRADGEPGLTERQVRYHFRAGHHPAGPAAFLRLRGLAAEMLAARLGLAGEDLGAERRPAATRGIPNTSGWRAS